MQTISAKIRISEEQERMLTDIFATHRAEPDCRFKDWKDYARTAAVVAFQAYVARRHKELKAAAVKGDSSNA